MTKDYYTVEQISDMLDIHPKTIQRYIREGRLRATKIGKSWRVTGHDLSIFVESSHDKGLGSENRPARRIITSSVIDIIAYGKEDAIRIMNTLTAALNAKPPEYEQSSMQSQYIERENMVRVTLWGDIRFMAVMMDTIASLTEQNRGE
ncbi:helix-turn-helix domain-containing protein [Dehalobacter sp. DCM]|uniref:helix-turn-helix domain-containing protein n=1 Tax=Dehalobacter sp. DCM TaxID=2907827 RepID=UPI003081992E|nr:helix-turn-helix domain-containing protein [Dehalobacter sp. DCM]